MSRSFILPVVALSGLAVAAEPWDSWKPGVPWQVVSREPVDLSAAPPFVPAKAVVWDVDLFLTSAADIAKFKARTLSRCVSGMEG